MSNLQTDIFIEQMWDLHKEAYLDWCDNNNWQADLGDFWVYLEDNNLIPVEIYEADDV